MQPKNIFVNLLLLAAHAIGVSAVTICRHNACQSAVNSNLAAAPSSRYRGCTSFFSVTVTPAPSSTTVTTRPTSTSVVTITRSRTVTSTIPSTIYDPTQTASSTVADPDTTVTETASTATDITTTTVATGTTTVTTTSTTDSTSTNTVVVYTDTTTSEVSTVSTDTTVFTTTSTVFLASPTTYGPAPTTVVALKKRTVSSCPTAPAPPSTVPQHASACTNTLAYSSACSCAGVTHGTTTLPTCTSTSVVTSSITVKSTRTKRPVTTTTTTSTTTIPTTITTTVTTTDTTTTTTPYESTSTVGTESTVTTQATMISTVTHSTDTTTTSTTTTITSYTDTTTAYTTTVMTDTTTTLAEAPTQTCNIEGMAWATFENDEGMNAAAPYTNFDPTDFKLATVLEQNIYNGLSGFLFVATNPQIIYNSAQSYGTYFVVNHRAYFVPAAADTYTFSFTGQIDDIAFLWIGDVATDTYTRENALLEIDYYGTSQGSYTYVVTDDLVGTYIPFRVIYGNAQGDVAFDMTLTDSAGNVILGPSSDYSQQIVQYSCDGVTAAPFPAFGMEISGE